MKKSTKIFLGILYWIWSLTWGALKTIPGLIVTAFCIVFLKGKPHKNGFSYIVEVGGNWGGVELGCVALCGHYYGGSYWEEIRRHEFGHTVQQLFLGPLQLFVVGIPSATRYWLDRFGKLKQDYDYAIYEYTASKWGYKWINWIEGTNLEYTYKRVRK